MQRILATDADRDGENPAGARTVPQAVEVVGDAVVRVPLRGEDAEGRAVEVGQGQRERRSVFGEVDVLEDLAAVGDADDTVAAGLDPDRALGVEADAVRAEVVGEYAAV